MTCSLEWKRHNNRFWLFEDRRGNKRLFLEPEDSVPTWVCVSSDDFRKCWPVPLSEMRRDTFTLVAVLEENPLSFVNDYAPAEIIETGRVKEFPLTPK
jgi:hypothetical protein